MQLNGFTEIILHQNGCYLIFLLLFYDVINSQSRSGLTLPFVLNRYNFFIDQSIFMKHVAK